MGLLKLVGKVALGAVVAVAVLTLAGKIRQRTALSLPATAGAAGFILLSPDDAANNTVIIMAPPNCPSLDAQRARALGDALARTGIPHQLKSELGFTCHDPDEMARVQKFMAQVTNPLVLIRGRAKGNPTLDEVIAEYHSSR
jgi:hypothetical protein